MRIVVNMRLYESWQEQVKIRKKRWNNKRNFIENKFANRKLEKRGVVRATSACDKNRETGSFLYLIDNLNMNIIYIWI